MGMFDDIECQSPLPDGASPDTGFQSKSLSCLMRTYVITALGRLEWHGEDTYYHGDLIFYGGVRLSDGELDRREYCARFTDGQLQWIRRDIPDFPWRE